MWSGKGQGVRIERTGLIPRRYAPAEAMATPLVLRSGVAKADPVVAEKHITLKRPRDVSVPEFNGMRRHLASLLHTDHVREAA
jgi:hypothetical protein